MYYYVIDFFFFLSLNDFLHPGALKLGAPGVGGMLGFFLGGWGGFNFSIKGWKKKKKKKFTVLAASFKLSLIQLFWFKKMPVFQAS